MSALLEYPWPGNIRELENVLERSMILADGTEIELDDLPDDVRRGEPSLESSSEFTGDDLSVKRRTAELESELIRRALERTGGNRTKAADLLLPPRAALQDHRLRSRRLTARTAIPPPAPR